MRRLKQVHRTFLLPLGVSNVSTSADDVSWPEKEAASRCDARRRRRGRERKEDRPEGQLAMTSHRG